jgi:hypothetical protein
VGLFLAVGGIVQLQLPGIGVAQLLVDSGVASRGRACH